MFARFIFYAIGIYMLYKLIFDFILPVRRTTKTMRQQFKEAQERMNEQMNNAYSQQGQQAAEPPKSKPVGDYIDFEEVKN